MEWVSLGLSVLALVMAYFADRRSRKTFQRESRAALHKEVEFKLVDIQRDGNKVRMNVANIGTETPNEVTVDPESIRYAAWDGLTHLGPAQPNVPIRLRFIEGSIPLESLTLTWTGPGTGRQSILIPKTGTEAD